MMEHRLRRLIIERRVTCLPCKQVPRIKRRVVPQCPDIEKRNRSWIDYRRVMGEAAAKSRNLGARLPDIRS